MSTPGPTAQQLVHVSLAAMAGVEYNRVHELSIPGLQVENLVLKVLTSPVPSSSGSSGGKGRDRGFSMALVG